MNRRARLATIVALFAVLAVPVVGLAQGATPVATDADGRVLPLDEPVFGASYGEWAARNLQWQLSFPDAIAPTYDETGARCGFGQAGPVWFLVGGDPASNTTRRCTVPAGVALYLPLLGVSCSTIEPPPFFGRDEAELRACAEGWVDRAPTVLAAALDGQPIAGLEGYRVPTPYFSVTFPGENGYGVPAGTTGGFVGDGFSIILAPLPPGRHSLTFGSEVPDYGVAFRVTYELTVEQPETIE